MCASLCVQCVCVCVQFWRSEDNLPGPVLSFHHVGPRHQTQAAGLGSRHLYLLNHLDSPHLGYFEALVPGVPVHFSLSLLLQILSPVHLLIRLADVPSFPFKRNLSLMTWRWDLLASCLGNQRAPRENSSFSPLTEMVQAAADWCGPSQP